MSTPTEFTGAPQAIARKISRQLRRFMNLQYSFG
jgi:hypothetical protein